MKKKINVIIYLISTLSIFIVLSIFSTTIYAQNTCSAAGKPCQSNSVCQPAGETACVQYACKSDPNNPRSLFGICQPNTPLNPSPTNFPTVTSVPPTPTSSPTQQPSVCSKSGVTCQDNTQCRPAGETSCTAYECRTDLNNPRLPYGRCQPILTPTPTFPPAPACSKANTNCAAQQECQIVQEPGCGSYYCLPDLDNPRLPAGKCQFRPTRPEGLPTAIPPTPPTPPPPCQNNVCDTAIGHISTDPSEFIRRLFGIILGFSGGIALLLIIYSGYVLMTSQGNPEKIQGAQETLTSAIVGLLFIIFSLVILQIIGVEILKIPGFER